MAAEFASSSGFDYVVSVVDVLEDLRVWGGGFGSRQGGVSGISVATLDTRYDDAPALAADGDPTPNRCASPLPRPLGPAQLIDNEHGLGGEAAMVSQLQAVKNDVRAIVRTNGGDPRQILRVGEGLWSLL